MSTDTDTESRSRLVTDAGYIAGAMLLLYIVFLILGTLQGYPLEGIISSLQRVTFLVAVYGLAVLALNLHWGYAGLFNIGVAGFMAVGVYTSVMLTAPVGASPPGLGLPLPVGIIGGMLASALVGLIAGLPALRLRSDYLAIMTVAVSEIIRFTYNSNTFSQYTGGASGFGSIPPSPIRELFLQDASSIISEPTALGAAVFGFMEFPGIGQLEIGRALTINIFSTLLIVVVLAAVYLFLVRAVNSPYGRVLKSIREDEVAAQSLGKNTSRFKLKTFMLGCALMGLAGIMWFGAIGQSSVYPNAFRPEITFYIFIALIIGGAGSNTGSVLGGALFAGLLFEAPPRVATILTDALGVTNAPDTIIGALGPIASGQLTPMLGFLLDNMSQLRFIFVGVLLIYLIQRRPEGLLGHRSEIAAATDLSVRPSQSKGGETDE
ncbi:branched-chain amino acid ABC transporter permease [Halosegnis rubeus]|uniref:Branched-chain amino acid ABC transporter permease n=1 Tax=Halosegnis rubeus TaxID=2212850 RepID=A0A5N5UJD6_9EURY|nr:branched-chain amino acid ABC transporter permease [Halosegnis rubeus]KAB7518838.1 branched-chain amino acid ABC transporter permease [Halosegnis rubeus]